MSPSKSNKTAADLKGFRRSFPLSRVFESEVRLIALVFCLVSVVGFSIGPESVLSAEPSIAERMSARIDQYFQDLWLRLGVRPATCVDDAAFLRRLHLDVVGHIATPLECQAFLRDAEVDKRRAWIGMLLRSPEHARQLGTFLRKLWLPQLESSRFANHASIADAWLAQEILRGASFAEMAFDFLTAKELASDVGPVGRVPVPPVMLDACERKPENLASASMSAFLGLSLE
ncbi:MAG: DUF1549 domain-containing protein [Planctomycetota bacterium]